MGGDHNDMGKVIFKTEKFSAQTVSSSGKSFDFLAFVEEIKDGYRVGIKFVDSGELFGEMSSVVTSREKAKKAARALARLKVLSENVADYMAVADSRRIKKATDGDSL